MNCPQNKHIHGNFGETAQMLAIRPDLVKMDRAENTPDFFTLFDYRFDQVSANGIIGGNATGATAEDGEELLAAFEAKISELVQKGLEEKIPHPRRIPKKEQEAPNEKTELE